MNPLTREQKLKDPTQKIIWPSRIRDKFDTPHKPDGFLPALSGQPYTDPAVHVRTFGSNLRQTDHDAALLVAYFFDFGLPYARHSLVVAVAQEIAAVLTIVFPQAFAGLKRRLVAAIVVAAIVVAILVADAAETQKWLVVVAFEVLVVVAAGAVVVSRIACVVLLERLVAEAVVVAVGLPCTLALPELVVVVVVAESAVAPTALGLTRQRVVALVAAVVVVAVSVD